jgi:chromosome segregation protein
LRLKKLELFGFKSFAERTQMEFGDGITGVVGPNGSGKSNIADAVRWVLGEQSAKTLRGAKMEDVIFGGTQLRRAQNYCEVSLLFDNADGALPVDFAEVQVTRRVYRSGESEYQLNKAACRLKDVIDLFRDTGIGKEGYSLIGQGRIDEILSVRSEDRRNIFEEAAGIAKFKARRLEAQRRLENTALNLARLDDIRAEVGSKLPELEKQSQAARNYGLLMRELTSIEANLFLLRHCQLEGEIRAAEQDLARSKKDVSALEEERAALLARSALEEEALSAIDKALLALNEELLSLTRAAQIHEGEATVLRERIASSKAEIDRLSREEENAHASHGDLSANLAQGLDLIAGLEGDLARLSAAEAAEGANVAQKEEELNALEQRNESAKQRMIQSFNRLTDVKALSARLLSTKDALSAQLLSLESGGAALRSDLLAAQAYRDEAQARCDEAAAQGDAHKREAAQLSGQNAALLAKIAQDEAGLQRVSGALREAQSRLKLLEQMRNDYEGYQNPVREILRRFEGDKSVHGVVASLVSVPKELERAIETALGGQMQNIVCAREEDAKRMIDALRANRLGRATFLPLSAIRGRLLSADERRLLSMPGCVGLASELVRFAPEFRPVFENLLGRTVIANDLEAGIAIMRAGNHAFRLVTLEGDMMHSGGSMTGGSHQARTTSLLSRGREIDEHRQAVKTLGQRLGDGQNALNAAKSEQKALNSRLQLANTAVHDDDLNALRAGAELDAARKAIQAAKQAADGRALECERLRDSIAQVEAELSGIYRQSGEAEGQSEATQGEIAALNDRLRQERETLDALREGIAALQVERAAAQVKLESARREQERGENSVRQLGQAKLIRERAGQALAARIKDDETALEAALRAAGEASEELGQKRGQQESTQAERLARQQKLRGYAERERQGAEDLEARKDHLRRLETRLERAKEELRAIADRLWERYELTLASAQDYKTEPFDGTAARKRAEAIRTEIRDMGMVNLAAIQEFEETSARYEEMSRQQEDLARAGEDLQRVIDELTKEMEQRFLTSFAQINEGFGRIFAQLFGGGTAALRLDEELSPLTSGIEIAAQPPGKKLQLLSLLSGGERALTAIALLFSMLSIRPSPFCILDEIEAALDEANVEGFARYLESYTNNTQFIVITHRKGTMEHCDTLYGVAMEEKGVSRLVSVRLAEQTRDNGDLEAS